MGTRCSPFGIDDCCRGSNRLVLGWVLWGQHCPRSILGILGRLCNLLHSARTNKQTRPTALNKTKTQQVPCATFQLPSNLWFALVVFWSGFSFTRVKRPGTRANPKPIQTTNYLIFGRCAGFPTAQPLEPLSVQRAALPALPPWVFWFLSCLVAKRSNFKNLLLSTTMVFPTSKSRKAGSENRVHSDTPKPDEPGIPEKGETVPKHQKHSHMF